MTIPTLDVHNVRIPRLGLGTWPMRGEEGVRAVAHALKVGYRAIDTAVVYQNETEVGEGIRAAGVPRDQIFITTKVWYTDLGDGPLQSSAEASLKRIGIDMIDLLLIHWPNRDIPLAESMRALNETQRRGLTRAIGISNFPSGLVDDAVQLSDAPIVANQCEYHPALDQTAVLNACRRHGIAFISYTPLGRGALGAHAVIAAAAAAHRRTPAQVILRWHLQQDNVAAIPKSATPSRIEENLGIFDFALSEAEMGAISTLQSRSGRQINPAWAPNWD